MDIRWEVSERVAVEDSELSHIAYRIAQDISGGKYDGYKTRSESLAKAVLWCLALETNVVQWKIHAVGMSEVKGDDGYYRVWVERTTGH